MARGSSLKRGRRNQIRGKVESETSEPGLGIEAHAESVGGIRDGIRWDGTGAG